MDDLYSYPMGLPSLSEQQAIANFLDHETAKIDTLIEKQQQLIQLLKEKRQAVISHAVTKGLNPNAPMKDSGVEWLGQVPEHWVVCALKYVSNGVFTGGTPKNELSYSELESDLNWFGPSDFKDTRALSESNKYVTPESHKIGDSKMFFKDSVLVIGIGATLGKVGYCNKGFSCNQQINVIYPNRRVSYKYLAIALAMQETQMKVSSNSSTIGIMNQEKTKSILIAVPPSEEQEHIVLHVESVESKYAKLIELADNQVELLQERRTALTSAAVTGKIDVRNWQAPTN
jgi:type I restriction enzyme S subunit